MTLPPPPPDSWASQADADVAIWTIAMDPGARLTLPAAGPATRRTLYFFRGQSVHVANTAVNRHSAIEVRAGAAVELLNGDAAAEFLLLQGRPIGEAVVQHGPFVMNTPAEIRQAIEDYQRTGFGGWPWPQPDPINARDAGRFARRADGIVERPDAGTHRILVEAVAG